MFSVVVLRKDEKDLVFPKDECKPLSTLRPLSVLEPRVERNWDRVTDANFHDTARDCQHTCVQRELLKKFISMPTHEQ